MVVRDVKTRWNYTHAMIRCGLLLQEVDVNCKFKVKSDFSIVEHRYLGFQYACSAWNFADTK